MSNQRKTTKLEDQEQFAQNLTQNLLFSSQGQTCHSGQKAGKTQSQFAPTSRTNHSCTEAKQCLGSQTCDCFLYPYFLRYEKCFSVLPFFIHLFPIWHQDSHFPVQKTASAVFTAWKRIVCSLSCMSFAWRMSVSGYRHKLRSSTQNHSGHYTKEIM